MVTNEAWKVLGINWAVIMQMRPQLGQAERPPGVSQFPLGMWGKWGFLGFFSHFSDKSEPLAGGFSMEISQKFPPKNWEFSQGSPTIPKVELGGKSRGSSKSSGKPQNRAGSAPWEPKFWDFPRIRLEWKILQKSLYPNISQNTQNSHLNQKHGRNPGFLGFLGMSQRSGPSELFPGKSRSYSQKISNFWMVFGLLAQAPPNELVRGTKISKN